MKKEQRCAGRSVCHSRSKVKGKERKGKERKRKDLAEGQDFGSKYQGQE